jgi:hypothetical protein
MELVWETLDVQQTRTTLYHTQCDYMLKKYIDQTSNNGDNGVDVDMPMIKNKTTKEINKKRKYA